MRLHQLALLIALCSLASFAESKQVRGKVMLRSIPVAFEKAPVVITMSRNLGPEIGGAIDRVAVAELRFLTASARAKDPNHIPFTLGDFAPRANATYWLDCYVDINRNGRRDSGDYWNQRMVSAFPEDGGLSEIDDFALIP